MIPEKWEPVSGKDLMPGKNVYEPVASRNVCTVAARLLMACNTTVSHVELLR